MVARVLRWERRPDDRAAELLEAALGIFAQEGYANTRLEDVAAAAGVSKGTIYHYFENKEALLRSTVTHYRKLRFARVEDVLHNRSGPVAPVIRLFVRRLYGDLDDTHYDLFALLIKGVLREVPGLFEEWLRTGPGEAWRLLTEMIAGGQASGEFRKDADPDVFARIAISGLMLQFVWRGTTDAAAPMDVDPDRLIDSTTDMLLAALRPART
jgi:AcrR family transcriptional regulator